MEYKRADNGLIDGTGLVGIINVKYQQIVDKFGEPSCFDDYKTDAEWIIKDSEDRVYTIYNYKDGINYCGKEGIPVEDITEWHIGGHSGFDLQELQEYINPPE